MQEILFDRPQTPVPGEYFKSTFALDYLTNVARLKDEHEFDALMRPVFGKDIPKHTYTALRNALLAGYIHPPHIEPVQGGPVIADYDNRDRIIRINSGIMEGIMFAATPDPYRNVSLLVILLHEFGHHIDNVLRHDLCDKDEHGLPTLAPDAPREEGGRFALSMLDIFKPEDRENMDDWLFHPDKPDELLLGFYSDLLYNARPEPIGVDWQTALDSAADVHGSPNQEIKLDNPDREAFEAGHGHDHHMTHRQIEKALESAGFNPDERDQIYFGNWLRDYSQLLDPKLVRAVGMPKNFPDVLSREALTRIVDVLSIKPFGRLRKTAPHHYRVTPEMLGVYRPSEHIDNPKSSGSDTSDPRLRDPDFEPLVLPGDPLLEVDYDTSMKRYLERSERFMVSQLQTAMKAGPTPEGKRAFGSALHVLEDFFAHSNFVELSLIKNGYSNVVPWTSPANCRAGLPLVTGMFGPTDVIASLAEPLGEVLFGLDTVAYQPLKPGDRSEREQILLILLEEHKNPRYLEIYQAYLSERDAWVGLPMVEYLQRCAHYLKGANAVVGNAIGIIQHDMFKLLGNHVDDWQTRYGEDPNTNGSTDPTHSQLAKDHADHPLHIVSALLAGTAVRYVGFAMNNYWHGNHGVDPAAVASDYFRHPLDSDWQDPIVSGWAADNQHEIRRAESKTELATISQRLAQTADNVKEQLRKDSVAYLDFLRGEMLDSNSPIWQMQNFKPGGATARMIMKMLGLLR
jgi:hypothetical protein